MTFRYYINNISTFKYLQRNFVWNIYYEYFILYPSIICFTDELKWMNYVKVNTYMSVLNTKLFKNISVKVYLHDLCNYIMTLFVVYKRLMYKKICTSYVNECLIFIRKCVVFKKFSEDYFK